MKNYEKFKNITIDNKQRMNKLKKILLFRTHSKKVKRRGRKKKYNLLEEKTTSTLKNFPTNKITMDNTTSNKITKKIKTTKYSKPKKEKSKKKLRYSKKQKKQKKNRRNIYR